MPPRSFSALAAWSGGILRGSADRAAQRVWSDSRTVQAGDLFIAVRGERFDAHAFLREVAERGAAGALVEPSRVPAGLPPEFNLIEVPDVGLAYQRLAAGWRRELHQLRVIAITGSNGKTSTKDFAAAVLRERFRTQATEGNLNNHVGLPRTVLSAERDDEAAVWEIGMNHFGEVSPLAAIAAPQIGIITNIGMAHIEFLRTRAGIAWEKGQLLAHVAADGLVILPASDDFAASLAARSAANVMTVGIGRGALRAESIIHQSRGSQFHMVSSSGEKVLVSLPVPGRHMIVNALLACAAGLHFGLSLVECAAGLSRVALTGGRLERKRIGVWDLLDDSYNANPDSVVAALTTLQETPVLGRRFAVLGRMGELGAEAANGHHRVGVAAASCGLHGLCVVGLDAAEIANGAGSNGLDAVIVDDIKDAADWMQRLIGVNDLTLVKGSRSAGLERLLPLLEFLPQRKF